MEKNKFKVSKLFYIFAVLCFAVLFSFGLFLQKNQNVALAQTDNDYVYNGYIFDEQEEEFLKTHLASNETTAASIDGNLETKDASSLSCYSLRDDYVIYTQNQDRNGFCWAYASSMAAGTTLMMATGQFYDFSEAWIGLAETIYSSSYIFGSGGNAYIFNEVINNYGLVLESDFNYENSYLISEDNNEEFFDYYSTYANKEIVDNLEFKSYWLYTDTLKVKNHILNNGALYIGAYWKSVVYDSSKKVYYKTPNSKDDSGHAVTIIGWDDNYSAVVNGETHTGAWVCLNSWGDTVHKDGVFYIFYDDEDLHGYAAGYEYKENTTDLYYNNQIKEGSGYINYYTDLKGKYYSSSNYTATTNLTQQQNMYFDDDVDVTYSYSISDDASVDKVKVYFGQEDVSLDFEINIDTTNKEINLLATNLESGPYKVLIEYSNNDESEEYINIIYVLDGTESEKITISSSNDLSNNGYYYGYNTYNYARLEYSIATANQSGTVVLNGNPATYSKTGKTLSTTVSYSGLGYNKLQQTYEVSLNSGDVSANKIIYITVMFVKDETKESNTRIFYQLDGGVLNNSSRLLVDETDGAELSIPTKTGYDFLGWYYDADFSQEIANSIVTKDNITTLPNSPSLYATAYYNSYLKNISTVTVYAKWSLKTDPVVTISIDKQSQTAGEQFTLNITIEHPLKKLLIINSINWYKDDVLIPSTNNALSIKQTIDTQGAYSYYAKVNASLYGEDLPEVTSDSISVIILQPINVIPTYSNGQFVWSDVADASNYIINFYYLENNVPKVVKTKNVLASEQKQVDWTDVPIENEGQYYIGLQANVLVGGEEFLSGEVYSEKVNFYKVSFVSFASYVEPLIVEEGKKIEPSTDLVKTGYSFLYWCSDEERQNTYDDQTEIVENITLYANWEMNAINISTSEDVSKTYDENSETISVNSSHDSGLTNFTYKWYYKKLTAVNAVEMSNNDREITVLNVSDSGIYYAIVTLQDENGFSVSTKSNDINVAISKYQTKINVDGVVTEYTYTGSEQTISSGAYAHKDDGSRVDVEIEYEIKEQSKRSGINKFIEVPSGGTFTLIVKTLGNDNYAQESKEIEITVNKAKSSMTAEGIQYFRYNGKPIKPKYDVNAEQNVVPDGNYPTDVNDEGYDIVLTAIESKNYLEATTTVHIVINPANIYIRVNDVSSVIFLGKAKLSYTIIDGEVYNNDDLGIELKADDVDTNKLGVYNISLTSTNKNYKIAVFEGGYRVTALPYYAGAIILSLLLWLVISILKKRRYQYEFESNGGAIVSPIDTKNKNAIIIQKPTKDGYKFAGWYSDMELTKPFNFKFRKSKGKTLYAKWIKDDDNLTLSEELKSAQKIVKQIQDIINPKKEVIVEEKVTEEIITPKEKTEQEKMQDFINSVTNTQTMSNEDMEKFINNIINNKE